MMEDFLQKGMDCYYLRKGAMHSISRSRNSHAKCSMLGIAQSENFSFQNEWHRLPGFVQKPLDLQLSADEFISRSADDFLGKGVLGVSLAESFKSRNNSPDEILGLDDLKLSLSIGEDVGKRVGFSRSWIEKKTSSSSFEIIDLEDPNLVFSNNDKYHGRASGFAAPNILSGDNEMLERVSQTVMTGSSNRTALMTSLVDIRPRYQRHTPCNSGFNGRRIKLLSASLLSKNKMSATCIADKLDLNTVKAEDCSCLYNDHSLALNSSRTNLSCGNPVPWKKANVNHCPETSSTPRQFDLNVDLAVDCGDKINSKDLDADYGEDLCSSRSNLKVESVGSLSNPSNSRDESQKANVVHSGEHDRRSSDSSESDFQTHVDKMLQKAAESLVQISLQTQEMGSKDLQNEEDTKSQCSSDSYAAMVLRSKESGPDDYCVSSDAFVVDASEKKENRYKLKRGTRMKDFQKDILPGLSILSRHEIHEDLNIIEGILRSREYKRLRTKFADGSDCFRPVKSKRTRVCHGRK